MTIYKIQIPDFKNENLNNIQIDGGNILYVPIILKGNQINNYDFNRSWHLNKYGFQLSEPEFLNYVTHRSAWNLFLESGEEFCCIIEENVNIKTDLSAMNDAINLLDEHWDVFFPFNKFNDKSHNAMAKMSAELMNPNSREMVDLQPFYLGILWGSQIYFLSKKGAGKIYAVNDIKQRIEDEFFFQTEYGDLETYYNDLPWFKTYHQTDFIPQERINNIYSAVLNYDIWSPEAKYIARIVLNLLSTLADKLHIDLLLQGGTHLGYIRHGGIMPWDDDIDIGIEENDLQVFFDGIDASFNLKYGVFTEYHTNALYYKIWHNDGFHIEGYEYTFPFIDIWVYNRNGKDIIFKNGIICPNSALKPLLEVEFEGARFKIPHNSIECLDTRYIDWKNKVRIYTWSHQEERNRLFPLTAEVVTDENGRILTK